MPGLQHLVGLLGDGRRRFTIVRRFDTDAHTERRRAFGRVHSVRVSIAPSAVFDDGQTHP